MGDDKFFEVVFPLFYTDNVKNIIVGLNSSKLCTLPYPNHLKGCPNFNKRSNCPTKCLDFKKTVDVDKEMLLVGVRYDFGGHIKKMRTAHPDWTDRQLECCLYWQGKVRKHLRIWADKNIKNGMEIYDTPEAMGVNVTGTMRNLGLKIEWPPKKYVWKVAVLGYPIKMEKNNELLFDLC